jgi:hypothetical protein
MKKLLAFLLAMMMVLSLCACGGSDDAAEDTASEPVAPAADAAEPANPGGETATAAEAPEGDASGEMGGASGEASGEASDAPAAVETVVPDAKYSKDFEGYRSYVIDAFAGDDHAPDDVKETTNAGLQAATDENDDSFAMLVDAGLVMTYADFLAN